MKTRTRRGRPIGAYGHQIPRPGPTGAARGYERTPDDESEHDISAPLAGSCDGPAGILYVLRRLLVESYEEAS